MWLLWAMKITRNCLEPAALNHTFSQWVTPAAERVKYSLHPSSWTHIWTLSLFVHAPFLPPIKAGAKITAYLCSLSTSPQDRTDWERKCLDSSPHFSFIITFLDKPAPVGSFLDNVLTASF